MRMTAVSMRTAALVASLLLISDCAHGSNPPASASPSADLASSAPAITSEVSALRSLAQKSPLRIQVVNDVAFARALHARQQKADPRTLDGTRATWLAFGFASPEVSPAVALAGVIDEQVEGFYDPITRSLYVREGIRPAGATAGADRSKWVLVHEIEHALQDQHFGLADIQSLSNDDARLARRSIFEGDATLVMAAYVAKKSGQPVDQALARADRLVRSLPTEALVRIGGHSPALLDAPPILREEMIFPYLAGLGLVSALYRAGGFQLVDQLFTHPPESTEQVLHPNKYIAGEHPVAVATPSLPPGYQLVTTGRLGELGARVLLAACLPRPKAWQSATGWGGDSFAIAQAPDRSLALFWSTVWDDDAHAVQFEAGLLAQANCWKEIPAHAGQWSLTNAIVVRRDGAKVAFIRGLPAAAAETAVASLFTLPYPPLPASPPLGDVVIPPEDNHPSKESLATRGKVELRAYTSDWLNLRADIPEGFDASTDRPGLQLTVNSKTQGHAMGLFTFLPTPPTAEFQEQYFGVLVAIVGARLGGGRKLTAGPGGDVDVGWAKGKVRAWDLDGPPIHVRAVLVPGCSGRGTLAFVQIWGDPLTRVLLDRWIASFRPGDGSPSRACRELAATTTHPSS